MKSKFLRTHAALIYIALLALPALLIRPEFRGGFYAYKYLVSLAILGMPLLFCSSGLRRIYLLLTLTLISVNVIEIGYFITFRTEPTFVVYDLIFMSGSAEKKDYVTAYGGSAALTALYLALALPALLLALIAPPKNYHRSIRIAAAAAFGLLLIGATFNTPTREYLQSRIYPFSQAGKVYSLYIERRALAETSKNRSQHKYSNVQLADLQKPQTIVVVVGESARRDHFQIYGYSRNTTPYLARAHASGDIIAFNKVISAAIRTVPSLQTAFSQATASDMSVYYKTRSLLHLAGQAGYRVTWLSNHARLGSVDTGVTSLTDDAHSTQFISSPHYGTYEWDEKLLPVLDRELARPAQRKIIFLHCLGSHYDYAGRYPPQHRLFPASSTDDRKNMVDHYDNSILYTDHLLKLITERLAGSDSAMVYFSDHGEELFDGGSDQFGHGLNTVTRGQIIVPLILWLSKTARSNNALFWSNAQKNVSKESSLEDLFYALTDLFGISHRGHEPQRSLFNSAYKRTGPWQALDLNLNPVVVNALAPF